MIRVEHRGASIGVHTANADHAFEVVARFWSDRAKTVPVDISGFVWRAEARVDVESVTADAVLTVTSPSAGTIIVAATKTQMQALAALDATTINVALDQVSPTDRPMLYWQLVITRDAAR